MIKIWQLRALAVTLCFVIPLASSCAREDSSLDSPPQGEGGSKSTAGSNATAGNTSKAGSSSSSAGTSSNNGGTTGGGGKPSTAGTSAEGGEPASNGGTSSGGKGGAGGTGGTGTTVPPDVLARASAIVEYETDQVAASTKTIFAKLHIVNQSVDPLPMANVKIRYWFTAEATPELHQYYVSATIIGPKAAFVEAAANSHVLLTFTGGQVKKGDDFNLSEIQLTIANNLTAFTQSDDFSWQPTSTTHKPNGKITLYLDDTLIWGCEPSGKCFDDDDGTGGAGAGGQGAGGAP
jgi:hypothetical protein